MDERHLAWARLTRATLDAQGPREGQTREAAIAAYVSLWEPTGRGADPLTSDVCVLGVLREELEGTGRVTEAEALRPRREWWVRS